MKIVLRCIEVNGFPRMVVEGATREKTDGVRLSNWALERERELRTLCDVHKTATLETIEQYKNCSEKGKCRVWAWKDLWRRTLEILYGNDGSKVAST